MSKRIEVVSGVIIRRGQWHGARVPKEPSRILLTQRRSDQDYPFKWESPGGKVKEGETPVVALARELGEELGITDAVIVEEPLWSGKITIVGGVVCIQFHLIESFAGKPMPREGQGMAWWTEDALNRLELLPGNEAARDKIWDVVRANR